MKCPKCDAESVLLRSEYGQRKYRCACCTHQFTTHEVPVVQRLEYERKLLTGAMNLVRQRLTDNARATLREKGYLR